MQHDERDPRDPQGNEWPSEDFAEREEPPASDETPAAPVPAVPWPDERPAVDDEPAPAEPPASIEPTVEGEPAPGQEEMEAPAPSPEYEPPADLAPVATPDATHEPPPSEVEAYPTATGPVAGDEPAPTAAHTVPESGQALGESTLCPRCGTENRPGLAFCRNCGQRLMAAGMAATVERPGAPEGTQACPRCGTHNRSGVAFCQNCGANLRAAAPGYVPPAVTPSPAPAATAAGEARAAILGPVVLLVGVIGTVTAYLWPFPYGDGSLFERALGSDGYGLTFWSGYPDVAGTLADQAYFGLAAPSPLAALLLIALAAAGLVRAAPGKVQAIGLAVALIWALGIAILFLVVELVGNPGDDLVGLLGALSPAGIIFFLSALIVVIGTLTRFARS